jgi:hypothetical protein
VDYDVGKTKADEPINCCFKNLRFKVRQKVRVNIRCKAIARAPIFRIRWEIQNEL